MIGLQALPLWQICSHPSDVNTCEPALRNLLTVLSCKFHLDSNHSPGNISKYLAIPLKQSETPSKQVHLSSGTSFVRNQPPTFVKSPEAVIAIAGVLHNEHGFFNGRHSELCTRRTQYGGSQQAQRVHPQGRHPECHQTVRPPMQPLTSSSYPSPRETCLQHLLTLLVFLQPTIRINDPHALPDTWNLRIPRRRRQPHALDRHRHRPNRNPLLRPHAQALLLLPSKLPLFAAYRSLQDAHLPPQHRLQRPDLSGHPERQVECRVQRAERLVEFTESVGGAE
jgi:hypothetical protein